MPSEPGHCRGGRKRPGVSLFCVREDYGRMDVDAVEACEAEDGVGQFRFECVGAVAEVGFGGTHVRGIRHRVFAAFRETIQRVGEFAALGRIELIVHNRNLYVVIYM